MNISDFDYNLPEEKIAVYPQAVRGNSKLLALDKDSGLIEHKHYVDISDYLQEGDVLVLNDTKVIKARIKARKVTGGILELVVLEKHKNNNQLVLYRGHLKVNDELRIQNYSVFVDEILPGGRARIRTDVDIDQLVDEAGEVPIPPYLKRKAEKMDEVRYQTVFAQKKGSVAAPTASLNFTDDLREKLLKKNVTICYITLHVGLGTFLPIRSDTVEHHQMHEEYYIIPSQTIHEIRKAKHSGKKIAALGTTVTRALEHASKKILTNKNENSVEGEADIFIYPGYTFKIVDSLITNFHAPRSTVLLFAAAFAGWENLQHAYEVALDNDYKFLSYGDSMLIY